MTGKAAFNALKAKATAYELQLIDVLEDLNQYCKEDCEYGETCVPTANSCKILKIRNSIRLGG